MAEHILSTEYWKERLKGALQAGQLHQAVFRTSLGQWEKIEAKHREILAKLIQPEDTILDAACGWGRLLDLLPSTWRGEYCGVDISPDFIELAWEKQKERWATEYDDPTKCKPHTFAFLTADLRELQRHWRIFGPIDEKYNTKLREMKEHERTTQDLTNEPTKNFLPERKWDWGILISVRPMIKRNLGEEVWAQMESQLRMCCEKLLYLEYDPSCNGFVE